MNNLSWIDFVLTLFLLPSLLDLARTFPSNRFWWLRNSYIYVLYYTIRIHNFCNPFSIKYKFKLWFVSFQIVTEALKFYAEACTSYRLNSIKLSHKQITVHNHHYIAIFQLASVEEADRNDCITTNYRKRQRGLAALHFSEMLLVFQRQQRRAMIINIITELQYKLKCLLINQISMRALWNRPYVYLYACVGEVARGQVKHVNSGGALSAAANDDVATASKGCMYTHTDVYK